MTDFIEQRSPEWYATRVGRVTGSLVGAILGMSPNKNRRDVMRIMVRDREGAPKEDLGDFVENTIMAHGRHHESGALVDFQMDTGLKTRPATFVAWDDWLGASPDAYTSDDGVLEIKIPWSKRKEKEPVFKSCEDQPHYHAQVMIECYVTRKSFAHFYQYVPARMIDGVMYDAVGLDEVVPYDQTWIDRYLPILRQFHAEFLDEDAADHLGPLRAVVDTPTAHKMVNEWDDLSETIDNLTARKAELLQEMVELAGERNSEFAGRKMTKTIRTGAISYAKAIKELLPKADLSKWKGKDSEFWGLK